jgi:hypothetical protein
MSTDRDPAFVGWAAPAVVGAAVVAILLVLAILLVTERSEGEVVPDAPPPYDSDSFGC